MKSNLVSIEKTNYQSARDLQDKLGYTEWRNFEGVVKRVISIIIHKHLNGKIIQSHRVVTIGSGAKRKVKDYLLDANATLLLTELTSSYKLNNIFKTRNESVVLQLVSKYCHFHTLDFEYQFCLENYVYDCMVGGKVLIEFDEPHHNGKRQKEIDRKKDIVASNNEYSIFRMSLKMDIIDVVVFLEKFFQLKF